MNLVKLRTATDFPVGRGCWAQLLEKQLDAAIPNKMPSVTKTSEWVTIEWDVDLTPEEVVIQNTVIAEHDTRVPWQAGLLATPVSKGFSILAGFNAAGGITIDNSNWVDLTWDTHDRKDRGYQHTLGESEIEFTSEGNYEIQAELTVDMVSGSSRTQSEVRFVRNGVFMPGTKAFMYNRNAAQGGASCSIRILRNMNAGDKLKIQCIRVAGNGPLRTHPHGCRIYIEKKG